MRALLFCLALSFAGSLGGCFLNNASPQKKLSESIRDMNNAAHWGRVGQAALYVDPKYRSQFVARRAHWTGEVQLAEHEVVNVQADEAGETAIAIVTCSWYGLSDMSLHSTVIQQTWKGYDGEFALVEEHVVRGDPALLLDIEPEPTATPKPKSETAKPGSAEPDQLSKQAQ
jgi:hypothetical protein